MANNAVCVFPVLAASCYDIQKKTLVGGGPGAMRENWYQNTSNRVFHFKTMGANLKQDANNWLCSGQVLLLGSFA